jgi:hypothetical protein
MTLHKRVLCIAGLGIVLGTSTLPAAEHSAPAILKHAYRYISSLDRYAFKAVVMDDIVENGTVTGQYREDVSVKVKRPNDLRVDVKGETKNRSTYLHNGLFTMIDHGFGYYGQLKLPHKNLNRALDDIFHIYGIKAPLAALIYSDMDKRSRFTKSVYFGKRTVGGVVCDYIAFRNRGGEVHVWISRGEKPLVKSFTIIDTTRKEKPKTTASIRWNTNPDFTEKDFIFKAPEGSSNISIKRAR